MKESCGNAEIGVLRQNGVNGIISVQWKTIDKSAISGKDYTGGEGCIEFRHGEVSVVKCSFYAYTYMHNLCSQQFD